MGYFSMMCLNLLAGCFPSSISTGVTGGMKREKKQTEE